MASMFRVSSSIRRWSSLCALPVLAGLALAACGGKVVVDTVVTSSGGGGAGGGTVSSAAVSPTSASGTQSVCESAIQYLDSCIDGGVGVVDPLPACEGAFLCQMQCILATNCGVLAGTDTQGVIEFSNCLDACGV